jgi:hypothetical protein
MKSATYGDLRRSPPKALSRPHYGSITVDLAKPSPRTARPYRRRRRVVPLRFPAPVPAPHLGHGPILRIGCSGEALVGYLTLSLRALWTEVVCSSHAQAAGLPVGTQALGRARHPSSWRDSFRGGLSRRFQERTPQNVHVVLEPLVAIHRLQQLNTPETIGISSVEGPNSCRASRADLP